MIDVNKVQSPRVLILLMGYSPNENKAPSTRAITLYNEIRKNFPDTYLCMNEGDTRCDDNNYYLLRPLFSSKGKYRIIRSLKYIISKIHIIIEILIFIRQKKITSIILRGYDTAFLFPFLKIQKIKTFYDFHGRLDLEIIQQNRQKRNTLAAFVYLCDKINLHLADKILVVSEGILSQIPEYQHKCLILQNGVDIKMIELAKNRMPTIELPVDVYIVGFIGNWEQVMIMDDICNAVDSIDNAISLIIGKGYDAERIFSHYNDGIKHIFTGQIDQKNAINLLHRMNVCVIPYNKDYYMSNIRNFFSSRKIFEYISAGKPIIISNIKGKPEFLIENKNCLIYESGNPKDLAEKILLLKNNPKIAEEMSKNNKELSKKFTWKDIIENSGILDELI